MSPEPRPSLDVNGTFSWEADLQSDQSDLQKGVDGWQVGQLTTVALLSVFLCDFVSSPEGKLDLFV